MRALPGPLHAGICRMPLVYGFVKLMNSLALRIAGVCKLRYKTCLLYVDRCKRASTEHRGPNTHVRACKRDIRNFVQTRRWATILDPELYRGAWLEEVAWAESSFCKRERETGQTLP